MAFALSASSLIGIAGLGISAVGAYSSYSAAKDSAATAEANTEAAAQHAQLQNEANLKVQADNVLALDQKQNVEQANKAQMNLEATRQERQIVRSSIAARSQALTQMTAQGASGAGSSAAGGVIGSIAGQSGVNMLGVTQNQDVSNAIFGYHAEELNAYKKAAVDGYVPATTYQADTSGTTAALASGLTSLGGVVSKNSDTISKLGTYFGSSTSSNPYYGPLDYNG